jgi:phosphonate transport system substrate-binding protein
MNKPKKLNLVSYLAPSMFSFYEAVATYISRVFNLKTELVQSQYDPLEDPVLIQDQLDIAFICGLPFALHHRIANQLQAIVAPVMQASRYNNCPIYFSDIIVNVNSNYQNFADLEGKTFCYNDFGSNSGYNLVRQRLLKAQYLNHFFGKVIQSGSHQNSMKWIVEGIAECAAIDSTVLEQLRDSPLFYEQLRVIDTIGPCPMPPVVAAWRLGSEFLVALQSALCQPDQELQEAMQQLHIQRYAVVQSEDYQSLATSYDTAVKAGYLVLGNR